MSEGYIVEIDEEAIGIVVRQDGEKAFRFHASAREFHALDGSFHDGPASASRAARSLVEKRARSQRETVSVETDSVSARTSRGELTSGRRGNLRRYSQRRVNGGSDVAGRQAVRLRS